jgi:hypothetical protein
MPQAPVLTDERRCRAVIWPDLLRIEVQMAINWPKPKLSIYGTSVKFSTNSRWPASNSSFTWASKATSRKHNLPDISTFTTPEAILVFIESGIASPKARAMRAGDVHRLRVRSASLYRYSYKVVARLWCPFLFPRIRQSRYMPLKAAYGRSTGKTVHN